MADSPFNSAPSAAWLAAFDLKNTGQNPQVMRDSVQPVADSLPYYLLPWAAHSFESLPNITARFDGVLTTVPDGELWAVEAISGTAAIPAAMVAADGVGVYIGFRRTPAPSNSSVDIAANYTTYNAPTAGVSVKACCQLPRLLLLGPGGGIFSRLATTVAAPGVTMSVSISYYRIPL